MESQRYSNPKTTRQWGVSPNHRATGSDSKGLAALDRPLMGSVQQPNFIPEATIALHPMERVRQVAINLGHIVSPAQRPEAA